MTEVDQGPSTPHSEQGYPVSFRIRSLRERMLLPRVRDQWKSWCAALLRRALSSGCEHVAHNLGDRDHGNEEREAHHETGYA